MIESIPWTKVFIYAFILLMIYIFVKLTNLRFFGRPVLNIKWRIAIALLFPIVLVIGLLFGAVIFAIVLVILLVLYIGSLFGKKRKIVIKF